jgi:AmiR/NasT family two-component response regulator
MCLSSRRVVIVEDEILIAEALRLRLERMGCEVVGTVDSGEEALNLVANTTPDLVLMDIRLAGPMDGITAGEHIHSRFGLPVVYLTANSDPETIERVISSQPYGYISKPINDATLRSTLSIAFQKSELERTYRRAARTALSVNAGQAGISRFRAGCGRAGVLSQSGRHGADRCRSRKPGHFLD